MWSVLVKLIFVALAAWVVVSLLRGRYVFEIRVREGRPCVRHGKVTPAFLGTVAQICQSNRIVDGWIAGRACGTRVRLQFSRHFPTECRQQLRNDWQFVG